jgi:pimeloyl-ACP methyl ester carboxylesterase
MVSVRVLGFEVIAIGRTALWLTDRLHDGARDYDPNVPHPTPILFVHGFLGDRTNFHLVETTLALRGVMNVAHFTYAPRLDWPRLATHLGHAADRLREATGSRRVDLVGHSLGGLIARYLVEMRPDVLVRRLVTLGSPYFSSPMPRNELAVFGASDPIVPPPHPRYGPHAPHLHAGGRAVVVPECGHWGLLVHEQAMREIGRFLTSPDIGLTHSDDALQLDRAS